MPSFPCLIALSIFTPISPSRLKSSNTFRGKYSDTFVPSLSAIFLIPFSALCQVERPPFNYSPFFPEPPASFHVTWYLRTVRTVRALLHI